MRRSASSSDLIRGARERAGLTQNELAVKLAVSQPVIARLERPGANPRLSTLNRVIAATGHGLELSLTSPSGIDETMIAADLKLTADERMRRFEAFYTFAMGGRARKRWTLRIVSPPSGQSSIPGRSCIGLSMPASTSS